MISAMAKLALKTAPFGNGGLGYKTSLYLCKFNLLADRLVLCEGQHTQQCSHVSLLVRGKLAVHLPVQVNAQVRDVQNGLLHMDQPVHQASLLLQWREVT